MNRNQTPAAISASSTDLQKTCFSIFRLFSSNMKMFCSMRAGSWREVGNTQ